MDRMKKLRKFLINNEYTGMQTFNTRNTVDDDMETIYQKDGIIVEFCRGWEYLEILV